MVLLIYLYRVKSFPSQAPRVKFCTFFGLVLDPPPKEGARLGAWLSKKCQKEHGNEHADSTWNLPRLRFRKDREARQHRSPYRHDICHRRPVALYLDVLWMEMQHMWPTGSTISRLMSVIDWALFARISA